MDEYGKWVYNLNRKWLEPDNGPKNPPPPPLPKYDPNEEAPKWNWTRMFKGPLKPEIRPDIPMRGGVAESDDKPDWRGVIKNNVIPAEEITKYDFGQPEYQGYYWFDTPDYADPFKKLWSSFKIHLRLGLMLGCTIAILQGRGLSLKDCRHLFRYWTGPFIIGGMTASTTVITVANLRGQKDDLWNYFAGAMAAGAVTGRANYIKHMNHSILWTITALSVKYMNEVNGVLIPVYNMRNRNLGIHGNNAQEGIMSGEFPRIHGQQGDPGRDVRRHPL